jgi:hypothetical protein
VPQALILARRFSAATGELCSLRPSADRDYLAAEAMWRQGDLCDAVSFLDSHASSETAASIDGSSCNDGSRPACAGPRKLARLLQQLHPLADLLRSADEALDDGELLVMTCDAQASTHAVVEATAV